MSKKPDTGDQSVITTKEARKLLGHKAKNLTNVELESLIRDTETVVRLFIRQIISSKNSEKRARMSSEKAFKA